MNKLLTANEAAHRISLLLDEVLDKLGLVGEQREEAAIYALDYLNRMMGGPGVELEQ